MTDNISLKRFVCLYHAYGHHSLRSTVAAVYPYSTVVFLRNTVAPSWNTVVFMQHMQSHILAAQPLFHAAEAALIGHCIIDCDAPKILEPIAMRKSRDGGPYMQPRPSLAGPSTIHLAEMLIRIAQRIFFRQLTPNSKASLRISANWKLTTRSMITDVCCRKKTNGL